MTAVRRNRKGWESLSPVTRRRYERKGVTKAYYEAGGSLKIARGHGSTPERPERAARKPHLYGDYLSRSVARRKAMRVMSTDGPLWIVGISKSERALVGQHWNWIKQERQPGVFFEPVESPSWARNVGPLERVTGGATRFRKQQGYEPDYFRNMTVSGYAEGSDDRESFELETDPERIDYWESRDELDYESIYKNAE